MIRKVTPFPKKCKVGNSYLLAVYQREGKVRKYWVMIIKIYKIVISSTGLIQHRSHLQVTYKKTTLEFGKRERTYVCRSCLFMFLGVGLLRLQELHFVIFVGVALLCFQKLLCDVCRSFPTISTISYVSYSRDTNKRRML